MKKILLFAVLLVLTQCQIKAEPKEAIAASTEHYMGNGLPNTVYSWSIRTNGMTYNVFSFGNGAQSASINVINVTKDSLEVKKLQLEIENLKIK